MRHFKLFSRTNLRTNSAFILYMIFAALLQVYIGDAMLYGSDTLVCDPPSSDKGMLKVANASWQIDLDIDSDNNNTHLLPDRNDWEDSIEEHTYSIGKLVHANANNLTPVVIQVGKAEGDVLKIPDVQWPELRLRLEVINAQGEIRLWHRQPAGSEDGIEDASIVLNRLVDVQDIGLAENTGLAIIWLQSMADAPGLQTRTQLERGGRPDVFLRVSLFDTRDRMLAMDQVKFLPVAADSFLAEFVKSENRVLRNSVASILVNGKSGINGVQEPEAPNQSTTYGLCLVKEHELEASLELAAFHRGTATYILRTIYYHLPELVNEKPGGVANFRVGLYRDYNSGEYTLAFQRNLKDKGSELFGKLKPMYFERTAHDFILFRRTAAKLGYYLGIGRNGISFPGIQFTGIGTGGELAVSASLASRKNADVFNSQAIPREMLELIHTRLELGEIARHEHVPGILGNLKDARNFVNGYRLSEVAFEVRKDRFPIVVE